MHHYLNQLEPANQKPFPASTNFTRYGVGKYALCVSASALSAFLFYRINPLLTPLAALVFYFFEVQLLFLFPLLIDEARHPVGRSVRATQKIGMAKALITVMPIAFYMVAGLRKKKDPRRQWYIGCLAILIWYVKEVRNEK